MAKGDLAGSATLAQIKDMLGIKIRVLYKWSNEEWFPEPVAEIAGTKLYNVSAVCRAIGMPLP